MDVGSWLRNVCASYIFDVEGAYRIEGDGPWPVTLADAASMADYLRANGHLLPLPKEPAALANVVEVSLVDHLLEAIEGLADAAATRGTERGYPDLEIGGDAFGGGFHAIDIKVARRGVNNAGRVLDKTQSRITLYTGNTYFKHPDLHWPNVPRRFDEYRSHWDVIAIYTLDEASTSRISDLEVIVQEPWKIASKKRSSTTREYIGAVQNLPELREGRGEFETPEAFYKYWRAFPFKTSAAVVRQLQRLLKEQARTRR